MLEMLLDSQTNDKTTILNENTLRVYDNGGPDGNYKDAETNSHIFEFGKKYNAIIYLDSEVSYDYLAIFKGVYQNMQLNSGLNSKFTSNGRGIPVDDLLYLEAKKEAKIITFEPDTKITLVFGTDNNTNRSGFKIIFIPDDIIRDVSFVDWPLSNDFTRDREFDNCSFVRQIFENNDLGGSTFRKCDFSNSYWDGTIINENTSFDDFCIFNGVNAQNIIGITENFPSSISLKYGHLFGEGVSHSGKKFGVVDLTGITFAENDLSGADLSLATLENNLSGKITVGEVFSPLATIDSGEFDENGNIIVPNYFGVNVALSADGKVLAIGNARIQTSNPYDGKVKVYQLVENSWKQKGNDIIIPEKLTFFADQFGFSVALSSDGNIVAVGGVQYSDRKGFACIYEFVNNEWIKLGERIEGEAEKDQFGYSIALSKNATRVAISARRNDGDSGNNIGSVRVYENRNNVWEQIGADIDGLADNENLGTRISLSSDGKTLLATTQSTVSAIRIYKEENNVWIQKGSTLERAGKAVISGDGNSLILDIGESEGNAIETYKFDDGDWILKGSPVPINGVTSWLNVTEDGSQFVYSIANNLKANIYEWNGTNWQQEIAPIATRIEPYRNDISDDGQIVAFGDYKTTKKVSTYKRTNTKLPKDFNILNGYLIKEDTSTGLPYPNYFSLILTELNDSSKREEILSIIKNNLPQRNLVIPTSVFDDEDDFFPAERKNTRVVFPGDEINYDKNINYYGVLQSNKQVFVEVPNYNERLSIKKEEDGSYIINFRNIKKLLKDGETFNYDDIISFKTGSLKIFYREIPEDYICFDGSEVVETDQGFVSIRDIDNSIHTIRQQSIHKLSRTRCKETKMVSIKKNALGQNIPNKDTLVTMNHQILYNEKMVPARVLVKKQGVNFVESNNQIVYNVMLPTYTYMRVNNMTVETLHPKNI